jgi:hypothetical protein
MSKKRPVIKATNRPDLRGRRLGILFHDAGPSGWGRIRRLGAYKGARSEKSFES